MLIKAIKKLTYFTFVSILTLVGLMSWLATVYGTFQGAFVCIPLCIIVSYVWAVLKNSLDAWFEMGYYEHHYGYLQESEQ